jgi:hypothetical protein
MEKYVHGLQAQNVQMQLVQLKQMPLVRLIVIFNQLTVDMLEKQLA